MTVLAITDDYFVEFDCGIFTVSRYTDGHCLMIRAKGVAGDFRDAMKKKGADHAITLFKNIAIATGAQWEPLYKPDMMPRTMEEARLDT